LCQITAKEALLRLSHVLHYDGKRTEAKVQNLKQSLWGRKAMGVTGTNFHEFHLLFPALREDA
jgi:hypothetical protein